MSAECSAPLLSAEEVLPLSLVFFLLLGVLIGNQLPLFSRLFFLPLLFQVWIGKQTKQIWEWGKGSTGRKLGLWGLLR